MRLNHDWIFNWGSGRGSEKRVGQEEEKREGQSDGLVEVMIMFKIRLVLPILAAASI